MVGSHGDIAVGSVGGKIVGIEDYLEEVDGGFYKVRMLSRLLIHGKRKLFRLPHRSVGRAFFSRHRVPVISWGGICRAIPG